MKDNILTILTDKNVVSSSLTPQEKKNIIWKNYQKGQWGWSEAENDFHIEKSICDPFKDPRSNWDKLDCLNCKKKQLSGVATKVCPNTVTVVHVNVASLLSLG